MGKRKQMLKRIQIIRQDFPQAQASDIAIRLRREIDYAQGCTSESLLRELPASASALHVFLELTPYMLQLEMVCQHLVNELPARLAAAGVKRVSFSILASGSSVGDDGLGALPTIAPFDFNELEAWAAACDWLLSLRAPSPIS